MDWADKSVTDRNLVEMGFISHSSTCDLSPGGYDSRHVLNYAASYGFVVESLVLQFPLDRSIWVVKPRRKIL